MDTDIFCDNACNYELSRKCVLKILYEIITTVESCGFFLCDSKQHNKISVSLKYEVATKYKNTHKYFNPKRNEKENRVQFTVAIII